ncbi:single-stranded DNA-binding protein [Anaerocolumna xylanovorans]|uniref:Single-stranded DNA-binding protein n=1 Tax=Anaerocolumna xylanovorans DSM 12503 TaxID=1121345 RepID=A0A1M7YNT8_9FIRM|nr:single-stranded DNA-binding protein [Anaerocolumna xylanovorans]SHO54166.1 single stranded DNA-binding protein (ssb) [Anaerocolumna xylanovorans DSM 12503]
MAQVFIIGRVTADFELQISSNKNSYVRFGLAENIGYGEASKTQYYQVWAWETDAKHLVKRKVKQGSLIWVSGSIELEEYTRQDGESKDKRLKVKLDNWDYVASGKDNTGKETEPKEATSPPTEHMLPGGEINGDKENMPD